MFEAAGFEVRLLEYFDGNGAFHLQDWHGEKGVIFRSKNMIQETKVTKLFLPL